MNLRNLAIGVGAGAAIGTGTFLLNREMVREFQHSDDPTAAILPTLTFAAWGCMLGVGGAIALVSDAGPKVAAYGAAALGAGVGMFGGGFGGLVAGTTPGERNQWKLPAHPSPQDGPVIDGPAGPIDPARPWIM